MMQYKDKLKDSRWLDKRQAVLARDSFRCVICGSNNGLNVHHSAYIYGREPWEYDNKYLVTLCYECHAKLHGKYAVKQTHGDGMVFYNYFLGGETRLSTNDKVVYSYLIYKSLALIEGVYSPDGGLEANNISFCMDDCGTIPISPISNSEISKNLYISRKTVVKCIDHIRCLGYISDGRIIARYEDISKGYFSLALDKGISGDLMVFYSYLYNKAKKYYEIDTYSCRLAAIFGKSKLCISNYLHRLYELGLAARLVNGKLEVFDD